MSGDAIIGWGICQGLKKWSGIWGISTERSPAASAISRIEFKKRKRSASSIVWALMMSLPASISTNASFFAFMLWARAAFSLCNRLASSVRVSSCFCFRMRDLRADSRFDSIRFLFLSFTAGSPPSDDPELAGRWIEAIVFEFGGFAKFMEIRVL